MPPSQKINLKYKIDDGEIDLSMCDLQEVPVRDIAHTKNVYSLDLSNNHLLTLPKNFATLKFLTKLDLSKNCLKELPDNFGDLIKLKHLDLYKNELQHLPISFSKLKSLKWLDLKDNPLVPVIREAAGQCLDSKQCLTCARNIVQFYNNFQQKLQLERETREKRRQKVYQGNTLALQKQKQQDKKNKKKDKKQKSDENMVDQELKREPNLENVTITDVEPTVSKKKICGAIFNYTKMFMRRMFFILLFAFLLTLFRLEFTRNFEVHVIKQWKQAIERLPSVSHWCLNNFSYYFGLLHATTGDYIHIVTYYVMYIINSIIGNISYIYERVLNLYYDLFKVK